MDTKIQVDGRIAKDPVYGVGAKSDYARFSLATDGENGETTWYNVTGFRGLAKLVSARLKKGAEVRVKGRLQVREYTKNDGSTGTSNDIIADEIVMEGGVKLDKFTPIQALDSSANVAEAASAEEDETNFPS